MTTARTTLKSSSIHGTGMFDDRAPPSIPHPPPLATPHEGRMVLAGDGLWYPSADEPIILHDQRRGPDEVCPSNRSTPALAQPCSVSSGTGSVNVHLNRMSSGQSIASANPWPGQDPVRGLRETR